jgi:hypothetical protein
MPQMPLEHALIACFAACTGYALLLNTARGRWLTLYATWLSVVIGCGIVLLFIATQGPHAVQTDLQFFAAGGLPVVVRSLWLTGAHLWAWLLYVTGRDGVQ